MMTMEYPLSHHQHKYACSTMSSETLSGSCGSRNNRIRTIRLVKRPNGNLTLGGKNVPTLGFSIRGGHEHGTGIFVSHVENGSEAHTQGLKVGDQIIRINGFTIEDAVHKEVLQLISSHTHLTLKVRSVGMIPVKDKKTDILSWQIITDTNSSSSRSSPQFIEKPRDVRINIIVAPRSKLGCGICKGPEWKPGIFVQFTKEGGIAREAGLRPGDQIVQCNNVDFSDIPFNEAVNLMKTSRQLDLLIRKAAASELFPGESSGYNSSASSVTEDQNSAWGDPKRLSIVKEENQNLEDRLNQRGLTNKNWNLPDWEEEREDQNIYKPTIINLSENGTTIKNNGHEYVANIYEPIILTSPESKVSEHRDSKIVVEVHRSDDDDQPSGLNQLTKSSSSCSLASKASFASAASSSLSSAISLEIKRRSEKKAMKVTEESSIEDQIQKKKLLRGLSSDQQFQHDKLMNEFKKAHQKMFKSPSLDGIQSTALGKDTLERLAHKELSQKLSDRLLNLANSEHNRIPEAASPPPPPPPPPLDNESPIPTEPPTIVSSTPKSIKTKPKAPPVPIKRSVLSCHQPPPCPTPDYDTLSLSSTSSTLKTQHVNESVEMDSLDSFKMKNPNDVKPKPPNNYFQKRDLCSKLSNCSVTSTSGQERPKSVNVSIGEYAATRSPPGRLDFLKNGTLRRNSGGSSPKNLATELSQTLNKSNLRKRTESMDDLLSSPQIRPQSNGTVRISVSNLAKGFAKSTSNLTEDFDVDSKSENKIMINTNQVKLRGNDRCIKNTYG